MKQKTIHTPRKKHEWTLEGESVEMALINARRVPAPKKVELVVGVGGELNRTLVALSDVLNMPKETFCEAAISLVAKKVKADILNKARLQQHREQLVKAKRERRKRGKRK